MFFASIRKINFLKAIQFAVCFSIFVCLTFYVFSPRKTFEVEQSEKDAAIENALYTRVEFFGANAIVPFPTEQARNRLAEILQKFPDDSQIFLKLAELDEKL